MKLSKAKLFFYGVLILIAVLVAYKMIQNSGPGKYDSFAQCLSDKGVQMYGAYWCPVCKQQKAMFGKSWDYIQSVECSKPNKQGQTQFCTDRGILSYPTWEFADGEKIEGLRTFEELAEKTNCTIDVQS